MKRIIIITALITAAAVVSLIILMGSGVDAKTLTQSECERIVKDFTGGKPVGFTRKIDLKEKEPGLKERFPGFYAFDDELYEYFVNPDKQYICYIETVSKEARESLRNGDSAVTEESAAQTAIDIFKKIESRFLVENGEISTKVKTHGDTSTLYDIEITETINGLPTGNCASMSISKTGNLLSGLFLTGDLPHIENLKKDKDKMISFEAAAQIAMDEIKARPELAAEDIVVDKTKKNEMSTRDNITVRIIYLTYYKEGVQQGAMVLVDAFSGEVIDVGLTY